MAHIKYTRSTLRKELIIQYQKHRGASFAGNTGSFRASNGVTLKSAACPQAFSSRLIYLQGSNIEMDATPLNFSRMSTLEQVVEAIKEYNNTFGAGSNCDLCKGAVVCPKCIKSAVNF